MQTYNTSFEESDGTHPVPTIIIGITYNKAGKHKEKVYRQITMVDNLFQVIAARMCFKKMKNYNHDCCYTTKPIEYFIMRFRGKIRVLRVHSDIKMFI